MAREKVALVTGSAQGIGRATARRLLVDGWRVGLLDADREALAETAAGLRGLGEVFALPGDVAVESEAVAAVDELVQQAGGIDALVNNAGLSRFTPFEELTLEEWNRVLGVNLTGALLCARSAAPRLRERHGLIVNIASTRALMSEPDSEAYAASKGGLVALSHALAVSLGPEVRVNCISPGWIEVGSWKKAGARQPPQLRRIDHAQHPAGRVGRPEDVAGLVAWLCSGESSFVTGAHFVVDGGMTRKMIYE
jgi:hypothetical protein